MVDEQQDDKYEKFKGEITFPSDAATI